MNFSLKSAIALISLCFATGCGPTTGARLPEERLPDVDAGPAPIMCGALATCGGACTDLNNNPANCGTCGTSCGAGGICRAGVCSLQTPTTPPVTCNAGTGNCDRNDTNGCEINLQSDRNNCGACGRSCSASDACQSGTCVSTCVQTACNGACVNVQIDPANCGACNNNCGANATCVAGSCRSTTVVCGAGTGNCDGNDSNRCETNTTNNPANCGGCGRACAAGQFCANSVCTTPVATVRCGDGICASSESCGTCASDCGACAPTCTAPMMNCDGNAANGCEANSQFDANNCGACGIRCGAGTTCSMGVCRAVAPTCGSGTVSCSGICCNLLNDSNNCGACGMSCGGRACLSGRCEVPGCPSGQLMCNGACRDIQNDPNYCGACGFSCLAGHSCRLGRCIEPSSCAGSGQTYCSGSCRSTLTDVSNCGACNARCSSGQACNGGVCQSSASICEARSLVITLPSSFHSRASCPEGLETVVHGVVGTTVTVGSGTRLLITEYNEPRYHSNPGQPARFDDTTAWRAGGYIVFSGYCRSTNSWIEAHSINLWNGYGSAGQAGASVVWNGNQNASYESSIGPRPFSEGPQPATTVPSLRCR